MSKQCIEWKPDILGAGFETASFELHPDFEGRKITTLVRHIPNLDPLASEFAKTPDQSSIQYAKTQNSAAAKSTSENHSESAPSFIFLAIHGWNDYFYQVELARAISALGGRFYAIDLAKYGRSHLPDQTWGYTTDLTSYDEDLHAARDAIYQEVPPETPFILYGHSTGGLIATLWADRHPGALTGLILNSPWLEIQAATALRQVSKPAIELLTRRNPKTILSTADDGFYQRTLTGNHLHACNPDADINPHQDPFFTTGWKPDLRYRHYPSFPVRAGWINAILAGHEKVAAGLKIDAPVLTLTSTRTYAGNSEWNHERLITDSVLRVDQIWKRCLNISNSLTLEKIPNAIHDVTFSRYSARAKAFNVIAKWINAILPAAEQ